MKVFVKLGTQIHPKSQIEVFKQVIAVSLLGVKTT